MDRSDAPSEPTFLTADRLILDATARVLTGPSGSCDLNVGAFAILRVLMRNAGSVVDISQLIEARWCANLEPANAATSIRMAVTRARESIKQVGGDPRLLRSISGVGYRMDRDQRVVRWFTPDQAVALDRLIATHPDAALAATVVPEMAA